MNAMNTGPGTANEQQPEAAIGPDSVSASQHTDAALQSADSLVQSRRAIEAILLVADQPVDTPALAEVLELPLGLVDDLCFALAESYESLRSGIVLTRVAGGYRLQSHPDLAGYVERFVLEGQAARLSQAALETLSIVAYKQPISRAQIAQIRGVNVDAVMRTLLQRNYIVEIGQDPGPGQASLFGTTPLFLESIGLDGLADLPPLGDFVPSADVMDVLEESLRVVRSGSSEPPLPDGGAPVETAPVETAPAEPSTIDGLSGSGSSGSGSGELDQS